MAAIDMVLHCPACGLQHIDAPDDSRGPFKCQRSPECREPCGEWCGWTNPPHRSHLCHRCGHIWRPADIPTNGVAAVLTKGKDDSPVVPPGGCLESTNAALLELREMADDAADADQAAKRAREAAAAYLRGCADRLEKGGAT